MFKNQFQGDNGGFDDQIQEKEKDPEGDQRRAVAISIGGRDQPPRKMMLRRVVGGENSEVEIMV